MKRKRKGKQTLPSTKASNNKSSRSLDDYFHSVVGRLSAGSGASSVIRNPEIFFPIVFLVVVTFAVLIPFVGKAYHIDDSLFIWAAKQIRHSPLDPYGFQVNWYGTDQPMWDVTKNPPLVSYYLAVVSFITGWSEVGIHLTMLIPAVFAAIGMYYLSRKFCLRPLEASLVSLLTPVFIVSGTTVMCDITLLAFWVWAVFLWMEGLDKNKQGYLLLSSIFIVLAALTKYYGIALIPLLLIYALAKKRRVGYWIFYFLIPLIFLCAYQWATESIYGRGLLSDAAAYVKGTGSDYHGIAKGAVGLVFTGGCVIGTVFYALFLWSKRYLFIGVALIIMLVALLYNLDSIGAYPIRDYDGIKWSLIVQFSVLFVVGINILAIAVLDLWNQRDAASLLLFLWIIGTMIFAIFINWTINGRSILPLVPAAGIVLMRRVEAKEKCFPERKLSFSGWALIPAALIAISVSWADYTLANADRQATFVIEKEYRPKTGKIWIQGHWGFQYYMESMGAESVDPKRSVPSLGDIVVFPMNASNLIPMNPQVFNLIDVIEIKKCRWLASMQKMMGAGFYSNVLGPLPFAFGSVPPERYFVWMMKENFKVK